MFATSSRHVGARRGAVAALVAIALALPAAALAADGTISTIAGTTPGLSGDGGAATAAQLYAPEGVAVSSDGKVAISDTGNGRVRVIDANGVITTVATSVGSVAVPPLAGEPAGLLFASPTRILVVEHRGSYVLEITLPPTNQFQPTYRVVAGTRGTPGYSGDGDLAAGAQLNAPTGIAALADGSFLIADTGNNRIRRFTIGGTITTVAGTGTAGFSGDGGPAASAQLSTPYGVGVLADQSILIADTANQRVRRVSPAGTISTVAGTGIAGLTGAGTAATAALLDRPTAVAPQGTGGGFVIADTGNHRIRRVTPRGVIFTIAGTGQGLSGDDGPASAAQLNGPRDLAPTGAGGYVVADTGNSRIRSLSSDGALPGPIPGRTLRITPVSGTTLTGVGTPTAPLREPDLVNLGVRVDATHSVVKIETATPDGGVRTALVSEGEFIVQQPKGPLYTTFNLSAPLNGCRAKEGGSATQAATRAAVKPKKKRKRRTRRIFVESDGGHRTRGRYADGIVRGTKWRTQDFCTSTRISVIEGIVEARDKVKGRSRLVTAGHRYTARKTARR